MVAEHQSIAGVVHRILHVSGRLRLYFWTFALVLTHCCSAMPDSAVVNKAAMVKRMAFHARGKTGVIHKRRSHLTVSCSCTDMPVLQAFSIGLTASVAIREHAVPAVSCYITFLQVTLREAEQGAFMPRRVTRMVRPLLQRSPRPPAYQRDGLATECCQPVELCHVDD